VRKCIILFLITGIVWAQTDFDKIFLIDGTEYLGEYLLTKEETVHFKQREESTFKKIPITLIKSIELRNGIITEFDINLSESEKNLSTEIPIKQIILYFAIAITAYLYFTFSFEYESDCVGFDCK
tara:strand:+ start:941 stop:1315 length:375 start_codon:yes stop_codon:yes gene_type:complete